MRIGITCYPIHGGSGVVATELGKCLAARGHEVAFVSYSMPLRLYELPERVSFHEVEVHDYPVLKSYPYTLALASKMAAVARLKKWQILHVHYAIPFAIAAMLAQQIAPELDLKIVTTLHGTDVTMMGLDASLRPVTELALKNSDAITAVSRFLQQEAKQTFKIGKAVDLIYNFIDPERHHKTLSRCVAQPPEAKTFTMMHISNFRPVKRVADVIQVFARCVKKLPLRLVLVGDGPDFGPAMQLVRELGLSERVEFVGVVDRVAPLLAAADVLLLPSQTESFGLVALEALASGVPVVASDVGGLPEVIEHGVCGYLAPLGDVDLMAHYVLEILSNPLKFAAFSDAARERAVTHFDYHEIVPQYEAVYERVLMS